MRCGDQRIQRRLTDTGVLAIRLMLATVFIFHGSQKLFGWFGGSGLDGFAGFLESLGVPLPTLSAYLAGSAEFFGGVALLTGVGIRLISMPLVITMLVAAFTVGKGFDVQSGGMEYPLTLAVVAAGIGLIGPGSFNLVEVVRMLRRPSTDTVAS